MDTSPEDRIKEFFIALDKRDVEYVLSFYLPDATLTTRDQTLTFRDQIAPFYNRLFTDSRRIRYSLVSIGGSDDEEHFFCTWSASNNDSVVGRGKEEFTFREGLIQAHTTTLSRVAGAVAAPAQKNIPAQRVKQAEGDQVPISSAAQGRESPPPAYNWPYGKCLVGVHGRADGPMQEADFATVELARVEAVKLLSSAPPEDVDRLRAINPQMFIMVRLFVELQDRGIRAEEFAIRVGKEMGPFYERGVRYFEVHNEPNLRQEGWQRTWSTGQEFGYWFMQVRDQLKANYPEALLGFPALSPGGDIPDQRQDALTFLEQADEAVRAADWVGVHCNWRTADELKSEAGGAGYREYQRRYPGKLLFITEFSNARPNAGKASKGQQYVGYYRQLRAEPGLGAAFSFVLSAASGFESETWRDENGAPTAIARRIGEWRSTEEPAPPEAQPRPAGAPPPDAPKPEEDANYSIFANNDRLGGKDELKYDDYAKAFASVLRNPDTKTPLTIGIYGAWGSGKSFLMQRIQYYLKAEPAAEKAASAPQPARGWKLWWGGLRDVQKDKAKKDGSTARAGAQPPAEPRVDFHIVEFNAWVYSGSENLWAGLITHLYDEVEQYLGARRTASFRFNRNARSAVRKNIGQLALFGLLAVLLSLLLNFSEVQVGVDALGTAISGLVGIAALGTAVGALVALVSALRNIASSLVLKRAEQLAALASRRDFRDKIGFMADIKSEISTIRHLLERGRKKGSPTRLVIFIDDLDRCLPVKAVEVLEAIMLLLADEDGMPFVVVLGLDARVVVKAVEERYGKVLTEAGISGYEYLDKIVQIPFRIPAADKKELAKYVDSLLWQKDKDREVAQAAEAARIAKAAEAERLAKQKADAQAAAGAASGGAPQTTTAPAATGGAQQPTTIGGPTGTGAPPATGGAARTAPTTTPPPARVVAPPTPEVAFTEDERAIFQDLALSNHLSTNPRRIKRIVNVYRIVRMLAGKTTQQQRAHMIKWVVLSEQWPYRTAWLLQAVEDFEQKVEAKLSEGSDLGAIYACVQADVLAKESQPFIILDGDPELFTSFITDPPAITVNQIISLRRLSFNLNPALQGEVIKAALRKNGAGQGQSTPPNEKSALSSGPAVAGAIAGGK